MKKLILAALTVLLVGIVCWLLLTRQKPQPLPALIKLPDGTSLRILAVTYGTNHVFGTKMARITTRLPVALQDILVDVFGQRAAPAQSITTPTPELLVWLDHRTNSTGATTPGSAYFTALLGDGSNFISGPDVSVNSFLPWSQVEALHFGVFSRRDRQITLNIFHHNSTGGVSLCNRLSFVNPLYRNYPQWQAEPLPATKRTDDVEVSLRAFETGHDNNSSISYRRDGSSLLAGGTNRLDGQNHTSMSLKFRPLTNTNEIWQVAGVEISDATGNSAHNSGMTSWGGNAVGLFSFTPGLWPTEAAWKLKLEIKRSEGFRPEEMFVFKHVPLGALGRTNTIAWATNVAGITVTLQSICRRAPQTNDSWSSSQISDVHFTISQPPAGTQLDLLRMVCDTGITNHSDSWGSSSNERDYYYRDIPLAAQTADFTLAVQQSRTVEFTVKPQLPEVKAAAGK
jgi:hypothetical protein